jgi:tRNA (mo5U34)-methyltransferase
MVELADIDWWHTIDLGGRVVTPGKDNSPQKLKTLHLPERLDGMSVLDVGTWDGFFAFECERRGAARVVGTDKPAWEAGTGKAGFDYAKARLGSRVDAVQMDLFDLSPETVGTFDVTLFLGVLYHVRDPLRALEALASVTRHHLILETHADLIGITRRPMTAFNGDYRDRDGSAHWWGPNPACVLSMVRAAGFSSAELVYVSPWPVRAARYGKAIATRLTKGLGVSRGKFFQGRVVVHGFK